MGLIKALAGSVGGLLADQWKEFIYCDSIPEDILMVKGQKRITNRSSNTKGSDNVISNGSGIVVNDGQCMIVVENGQVMDICAEAGKYTFDTTQSPSIFTGSLGKNLLSLLKTAGQRITYGGDPGVDQRVYYVNTKELIGNKYGTPSPVPFRVVDQRAGIDIDINVKCFGEYSYHIVNPAAFYRNVAGNITEDYNRSRLDGQLKTELLTALQPAFAKISEMGIRYSALPGHTTEMADALNEVLSAKWRDLRGLEIVSFGVSSVKANEDDEKMMKEMQRNAAYMDPTRAAAAMVGAQAAAMQTAAANQGGAAIGFMGMNMAANAGGVNAGNLFQMGQQQAQAAAAQAQAAAPAGETWKCACGATVTGKFCPECGAKKPEPKPAEGSWTCPSCGATVTGKFCPECGAKKPEAPVGWTCPSCGAVNKGRFCSECGAKKPEGVPQYKCDKCGWEPADPTHPPKFCPECGDPFDDGDLK